MAQTFNDKVFRFPGVSSLGSADPQYQELQKGSIQVDFNQPIHKLNPLLDNFSSMFEDTKFRDTLTKSPQMQAALFDVDNLVKSNAGIFRKKEEGLQEFGVDMDGNPLYAAPEVMNQNANMFGAGENQLVTTGNLLDGLGAFKDAGEADAFTNLAKTAGSAKFQGMLTSQISSGDKKGAVNAIMKQFGMGEIGSLKPDDMEGTSTAFGAFNMVSNWDKMNPSQRSLAMSGLALNAYKYGDGQKLGSRVLIDNEDPDGPKLTVGNALGLASAGVNVPELMKNWDQLDTIQRITFGKGTASQIAATSKRLGLLGDPALNGSATPDVSAQALAASGFVSAPSAGVGGIIGPSSKVPKGYSVVAAGTKEGTVVAVPSGLVGTAATTNGSTTVSGLGASRGLPAAGQGAYKVYQGWTKTGKEGAPNGAVGGTPMGAGLFQSGMLDDPYMRGAIAATSVTGNTIEMKKTGPATFEAAISQVGANSPLAKKNVNIKRMSQEDPRINESIGLGKSVVNTMTKFGSQTAGEAAPYVNAAAAGKKLYDVLNNPDASDKEKAEAVAQAGQAGTNIAASLGSQAAAGAAPGVNAAMAAYNASKILGSDMSDEEKAKALRRTAEDTAAAYYTFGLSALAQYGDQKLLGGKVDKLRTKLDSLNPNTVINDKINEKLIGLVDSKFGGGKSKDQMGRDSARKLGVNAGFVTKDFKVQLASGEFADVGTDGKGNQHEFRNPDKVPQGGEVRTLNSYDVDYTNDLDFSANMMTSSLMRLVAGGKGKEIDQFAGQLANAAISEVGFGQDMTPENFQKTQMNARGMFFQNGVKSKEDAYALANQAFAEQRITEIDLVAMHQGINMAFDEDGYDSAQMLMAGRWKGLEVSTQIPSAPGPNINFNDVPSLSSGEGFTKIPGVLPSNNAPADPNGISNMITAGFGDQEVVPYQFEMQGGNYWGPSTSGIFKNSLLNFKDPFAPKAPAPVKETMTKEQLREINSKRFASGR